MAVKHGKGSKVYLAEFDFSGEARSVDISIDNQLVNSSTFNSTAEEYAEGIPAGKIDVASVWDFVEDNFEQYLDDMLGSATDQAMTILPGITAVGERAYNAMVKNATTKRPIAYDNIMMVDANFQVDSHVGMGFLCVEELVAVGDDTGAVVDLGAAASATQNWLVCIHVLEVNLNGDTRYDVQVEESVDGLGSWSNVAGALVQATGVDQLAIVIAGARDRYVRVSGDAVTGSETAKYVVSISITK